jgi:hypothetical protein
LKNNPEQPVAVFGKNLSKPDVADGLYMGEPFMRIHRNPKTKKLDDTNNLTKKCSRFKDWIVLSWLG